jgi:hypothetical protein
MEAELHPEMLLLIPQFAITWGHCEDASCGRNHWRITLGWLIGSIHLYV